MTYRAEGGDESSLQLSDPAATEATLTDLQCNINYTISVVTIAGEHRRESVEETVALPVQGLDVHNINRPTKSHALQVILTPLPTRANTCAKSQPFSVRASYKEKLDYLPQS